jgi:hypothetical protein
VRARQELELARAMSDRLWAEHRAHSETLDPAQGVASLEGLRGMKEASEWTRKLHEAEHGLFSAGHGTTTRACSVYQRSCGLLR